VLSLLGPFFSSLCRCGLSFGSRRDVAASFVQLGQALVLKNDHKAALDVYRAAIAMLREHYKDAPK
jgi:hypothetical protein